MWGSLVYLCADDLTVEQVESWFEGIAGFHARIAHRFGRSEPRDRAPDYLAGLLAPVERKNGWTLAEQVGQLRPDGVQCLLNLSDRDEDAVRDDVRDFVVETIGARDGILIGDDTGFLKKAPGRPMSNANTAVPPAAPRTARSARSWPTPRPRGVR